MRGVSAKDHLTESIREPEAFVAEGVERAIPGLITAAMTASLSGDDVAALAEFLLARKYRVARRARPSCYAGDP